MNDALFAAMRTRYPLAETRDWFKLLYQSEFGCGHMVTDEQECAARLEAEYKAAQPGAALLEDIGGGYARLYLGNARDMGYPPRLLARIFYLSAQKKGGDHERFLRRADDLKAFIDPDAVEALKSEAAASGFAPFSHSEMYRAAYHPAYRVILSAYGALLQAIWMIDNKRKAKRPVIVGIDGRCGAGKTTAAGLLAAFFDASVVHMDDFFLPPALRTPARLDEPGGNIHYERFVREVAGPLARGEGVTYGVFDCAVGRVTHSETMSETEVVLIEGSYALHPKYRGLYDVRLFADVSPATQKARIIARNGEEGYVPFRERWIPLEEKYIEACAVRAACDAVIEV